MATDAGRADRSARCCPLGAAAAVTSIGAAETSPHFFRGNRMHRFSIIDNEIWFDGYAVGRLMDFGAPLSVQSDARDRLNGVPSYQAPVHDPVPKPAVRKRRG